MHGCVWSCSEIGISSKSDRLFRAALGNGDTGSVVAFGAHIAAIVLRFRGPADTAGRPELLECGFESSVCLDRMAGLAGGGGLGLASFVRGSLPHGVRLGMVSSGSLRCHAGMGPTANDAGFRGDLSQRDG